MAFYRLKLSGIYLITNKITNNYYLGMSVDLTNRFGAHYSDLKLQKHSSINLQKEFNLYGIECFKFEILEVISKTEFKIVHKVKGKTFDNEFRKLLLNREKYWMGKYSKTFALNQNNKHFS